MYRRISDETKQLIEHLYAQDLPIVEIAEIANVSYSFVYGLTRVKKRVNPETGKPFESRSQYNRYREGQRTNRPENQGLSNLIKRRLNKLGKNQAWLARNIGITHQAVSLYVAGRSVPRNDLLQRLYFSLRVPYKTLDDSLE